MSAGFAAADVSVSGDGRMGLVSTDGVSTFSNRMRIKFSGSGVTDGGMAFGGSFRANDAVAAKAGTAGSVYISGAFGKIAMGDVDSGDNVGQLASVGYTGLDSGNSISYSADAGGDSGVPGDFADAGGARVLYTYSAGAVTLNASSAQLTDGGATSYGVGAIYSAGNLTLGAGYGSVQGGTLVVKFYDGVQAITNALDSTAGDFAANLDASVTDATLSATYVMGDTTLKGIYQLKTLDASSDAVEASGTTLATYVHAHDAVDLSTSVTSMGLSVSQKMGAVSLTAYGISSQIDGDLTGEAATVSRYGIGATYDLGGGATISGGWAAIDKATGLTRAVDQAGPDYLDAGELVKNNVDTDTVNKFDIGVTFSF